MAVIIPIPPYKHPVVDSKMQMTAPWVGFMKQFFLRAGGLSALSNTELEALPTTQIAVLTAQIAALTTSLATTNATITTLSTALTLTKEQLENSRSFR